MSDNLQPYAEDEDSGFVHDALHEALEAIVRRIFEYGQKFVDVPFESSSIAEAFANVDLADFLTEITDALDSLTN